MYVLDLLFFLLKYIGWQFQLMGFRHLSLHTTHSYALPPT